MKKIIVSVIITVCVMTGIGYGIFTNISQDYEERLAEMAVICEEREAEVAELKSDMTELSEQVFNMKNGEAYEVTINHDDEIHTWKSDNEGLFKGESHSVVY